MTTTVFKAPLPKFQFNQGGVPLAGGKLFTYASGTTTKVATYTDYTGATPNANPIILDTNGQCDCWLIQGQTYTFVLSPSTDSDPPTHSYWTENGITGINDLSTISGSSGSTAAGVAIMTGAQIPYAGSLDLIPDQWLLCDGAPISRTTYATLFGAIGTTYGAGDGSTTFNLPDKRGRVSAGADAMGGSAANRLTVASLGTAAVQGVTGGNENVQDHTHTVVDPGHTHAVAPSGVSGLQGSGNFAATSQRISNQVAVTIDLGYTGITLDTYGTGASLNVQPVEVDLWIIYTGPNLTVNGPQIGLGATFANIAALQATTSTITTQSICYVEGYYTAGDGGQGFFVVGTSATQNGGTIINDSTSGTPRSWYRQYAGPLNPNQFGAKGDGTTNDATAINAALAVASSLMFLPGKNYYIASSLVVPITCTEIIGAGAMVTGPGMSSSVDGFTFTDFYYTGGSIGATVTSNNYQLPGITQCRRGVSLTDVSWVYIQSAVVRECSSGLYLNGTSAGYCVENSFDFGMIEGCNIGIDLNTVAASSNGIQGCRFRVNYLAGNTVGINGTFDTSGIAFIFNYFDITVCDGNGAPGSPVYCIKYNKSPTGGSNYYRFPAGVINMSATPTPFVNTEVNSVYKILTSEGGNLLPYCFSGFLPAPPVAIAFPADGVMTIYVNASASAGGNGSASAPFQTVQIGLNFVVGNMDMRGTAVVFSVAAGTYSAAVAYNTLTGLNSKSTIVIQGAGSSTIFTGGISCTGPAANITVESLQLQTQGLAASNGGVITIGSGVTFGACGSLPHIGVSLGGLVQASSNYSITGGGSAHGVVNQGGALLVNNVTITLTGTPAFTDFVYAAFSGSNIDFSGSTFSGSATGTRYNAALNAAINTDGGGANFFPGNSAGGVIAGGQYA